MWKLAHHGTPCTGASTDSTRSSDADAEVLADYVIALVVANDSEANIKRNCLDSLADFLQDCMQRPAVRPPEVVAC